MNTGFFKLGPIDPSNTKAGSYVIFVTRVTLATVEVSVLLGGSNSNVLIGRVIASGNYSTVTLLAKFLG